jgi:hypothetical protein
MEEDYAILLHSAITNYLPTSLPAQFFGMPNGSILIVFARFHDVGPQKNGVEFVFAKHLEFRFDYREKKVIETASNIYTSHFERLDKPYPLFEEIEVHTNLTNFSAAQKRVHEIARRLINETPAI